MTELQNDIFWQQEVPVNTVKTATALAAATGAVMLFMNPPVGLAIGIGSGVSGLAATAGDSIATKIKRSRIGYKLAEAKAAARELDEVKAQIENLA